MMRSSFKKAALWLVIVALATFACGGGGFDPVSKLTSIRVLATRADKPFAKPGDTVNVEVLAVDARADRSRAMHVYWLPIACTNPRSDLYYACFAALAGLAKTPIANLPPDLACVALAAAGPTKDITACLKDGAKTTITIPADAVSSHPPVVGAPAPYGLSIAFFIACAGNVRLVPPDPNNVSGQALPVGCYDEAGNALGPDDYVFGFTRVYAYDTLSNANPVIDQVTFDGTPVVASQGVVVPHCTSSNEADCEHAVDVQVPDSSWEVVASDDPTSPHHEEVWAAYFYTIDKTKSDDRILFDPTSGRVSGSANKFIVPQTPGSGELHVVVHDNRDGVAYVHFPIYVQ